MIRIGNKIFVNLYSLESNWKLIVSPCFDRLSERVVSVFQPRMKTIVSIRTFPFWWILCSFWNRNAPSTMRLFSKNIKNERIKNGMICNFALFSAEFMIKNAFAWMENNVEKILYYAYTIMKYSIFQNIIRFY